MKNVKLLEDRVLIEVPEQVVKNGVYVPDSNEVRSKRGIVKAIGPGKVVTGNSMIDTVPVTVKEGDEVLFSYGEEVLVDSIKYYLCRESDIMMIYQTQD